MKTLPHLWQYLTESFLLCKIFQIQVVEKIGTPILCSITVYQDRSVCEIMWKNMVEPERPKWQYGKSAWMLTKQAHAHTQNRTFQFQPLSRLCFMASASQQNHFTLLRVTNEKAHSWKKSCDKRLSWKRDTRRVKQGWTNRVCQFVTSGKLRRTKYLLILMGLFDPEDEGNATLSKRP
jgi:hypothetical protein